MEPRKIAVTVIPNGQWPDSASENRRYWLSRPAAERIQAAKKLRRKRWFLFHREDLPGLKKVFQVLRLSQPQ